MREALSQGSIIPEEHQKIELAKLLMIEDMINLEHSDLEEE